MLICISFLLSLTYLSSCLKKTTGITYFLKEALQQNASCLDGTPPVYFYIPGENDGTNKWLIYFEGGAWCTSLEDCYKRSMGYFGSSANISKAASYSNNFFSDKKAKNPLLYNWNKVIMHYCDGGSFTGDTTAFYDGNLLHFRGKNILNAIIDDLINVRGMKFSTDVVITGTSAGALSSILNADHIREKLSFAEKVVVMPDSGFFLDFQGNNNVTFPQDLQWVFYTMNCSGGVNQKCVGFYSYDEQWRCIFAEYTIPFVETPIFMLQSQYDAYQVDNILGSEISEKVNIFGEYMLNRIKQTLLSSEKNSGFIDSCFHHCGGWNKIHVNNVTQAEAFSLWYNNMATGPFVQGKEFKCRECCYKRNNKKIFIKQRKYVFLKIIN